MEKKKKKEINFTFKYVIFGQYSVGKTSLSHQFIDNEFQTNPISNAQYYRTRCVFINGMWVRLQIWDMMDRRFDQQSIYIVRILTRNVHAAIFVYDITNRDSFEQLKCGYLDFVAEYFSDAVWKVVVGNKCDLEEKRVVAYAEGKTFADENGALFVEASAKTGKNVDSIFIMLTERILKRSEIPDEEQLK